MQRMAEDLAEMNASMPQQQAAGRLTEVEILLAKEAEWHRWQTAFTFAEGDVGKLTAVKRRLFEGLGIYGEEAEKILLRADVSLQKEERMHELMSSLAESDRQIGYMNRQLVQLENEAADAQQARELIERTARSGRNGTCATGVAHTPPTIGGSESVCCIRGTSGGANVTCTAPHKHFSCCCADGDRFYRTGLVGSVIGGLGWRDWHFLLYPKKECQPMMRSLREMEEIIAAYAGNERQMEELIERLARYNREKEALHEGTRVLERKQHIVESELN